LRFKISKNGGKLPSGPINQPNYPKPHLNLKSGNLVYPSPVPVHPNEPEAGKIYAVTYASHRGRDDRFCRAVESAVRHQVPLVILGWGTKWLGLSQKLEAAYNFSVTLNTTDIMLFTDAFDVLYSNTVGYIKKSFLELNSAVVFSGECGCWPHIAENKTICTHAYPLAPTPYRFLNSGSWIGYAKPASEMLLTVMEEAGANFGMANDQKLIADMYIDGRNGIKLDFHNKLFQSMHMTLEGRPLPYCNPHDNIELKDSGKFYNNLTHSFPAVFHFNGGGKRHHLKMEASIWYKSSGETTREKLDALFNAHIYNNSYNNMTFGQLCSDYMESEYSYSPTTPANLLYRL
jgi:hypothetical protein